MIAILKPSPEISHEITLDALPRPGEAFVFDGMMYRAVDVIWNKHETIGDKTSYMPTILLYSQPYIKRT